MQAALRSRVLEAVVAARSKRGGHLPGEHVLASEVLLTLGDLWDSCREQILRDWLSPVLRRCIATSRAESTQQIMLPGFEHLPALITVPGSGLVSTRKATLEQIRAHKAWRAARLTGVARRSRQERTLLRELDNLEKLLVTYGAGVPGMTVEDALELREKRKAARVRTAVEK